MQQGSGDGLRDVPHAHGKSTNGLKKMLHGSPPPGAAGGPRRARRHPGRPSALWQACSLGGKIETVPSAPKARRQGWRERLVASVRAVPSAPGWLHHSANGESDSSPAARSPSARQPCRGGLEFCGKKRSNRAATTPCLSADASDTSPATARSVEVGHRSSKLAGSPSRKMSARRRTRSDGVPSVARPTAKSASATVPSEQVRRRRPHVSSASTATLCGRRGEDLTGWWPHGFFLGGVDGLGVDGSGSEHRNSVSSSWMAETELGDGTRCLTRLALGWAILPRPLDCSVGQPCGCILPLPLDCSMRSIARPRSRPRGAFDRRAALAAGSCADEVPVG